MLIHRAIGPAKSSEQTSLLPFDFGALNTAGYILGQIRKVWFFFSFIWKNIIKMRKAG